MMSIAQRLPFDFLELIFTSCWRIKRSEKWAVIDRTDFPIILLHVCSSWRKAALSTPILWSNLSLTFGDPTGDLTSVEEIVEGSKILLDHRVDVVGGGPRCLFLTFNWDSDEPLCEFVLPKTFCRDVQSLILFRNPTTPTIVDLLPEEGATSLPPDETPIFISEQDVPDGGRIHGYTPTFWVSAAEALASRCRPHFLSTIPKSLVEPSYAFDTRGTYLLPFLHIPILSSASRSCHPPQV